MIDDMLKLSIDPLFADFQEQPQLDPLSVQGYTDSENMWEYLFNLKNKESRKEAKIKFITPIQIKSDLGYLVKDRRVNIKRYNKEE